MKKTLVALVPVIHISYLELFKKYPQSLYIISDEILRNWDGYKFLERDLRAVDQLSMLNFIEKSEIVQNVSLLTEKTLLNLKGKEIVMPDEDISHWVAQKYLSDEKVSYDNIFLRWNRPVSTQEREVVPNRIISQEKVDRELIDLAQKEAVKSANWWRQIGAIVTNTEGEVVLSAFNKHVPTQQNIALYGDLRSCFDAGENHELSNSIHAEASLIGMAARSGVPLKNTNLYVSTFPCPTCAKLIAEAHIKKVYYKDGYSLSDAEDILKANEIEVIQVC